MKVGYSVVDITPPIGVELCGYGYYPERRSTGINDPLFVRAVSFSMGEKRFLMLNCDLLALSQKIVDQVKQKLTEDLGIDKKDILILSTHTHTGPNTCDAAGIGERDETYLQSLPGLLVKSGKDAFLNVRQVNGVKQIKTEMNEKIGYNRTDVKGPVNNELRGMAFYFDKGRPLALLNYGCHPVTLGPTKLISADFPGSVTIEMNKAGYDSMFINGFCGDIDPVSNIWRWGSGTQETIDKYGKAITDNFLTALNGVEAMDEISLDSFEIPVVVHLQKLVDKDIDEIASRYEGEKVKNPGKFRLVQTWAVKMKENLKNNETPYKKTLYSQAVRIGQVMIVGLPGEMFTSLADPLKEAFPDMNVITLGNANASVGYITSRMKNGGYEGLESNFLYLSLPFEPGEGDRLTETVAEQLKLKVSKQ